MAEKTYSEEQEYENPESESKFKFTTKKLSLMFTIAVLLIVIIIAGYFILRGKFSGISPQLRQMRQVVRKIRSLEEDIQKNQNEMFSLMSEYKEKTGKELPIGNFLNFSEEERRILEKKIKEEKNVTKALLGDILDKNIEIRELKAEIEKLEQLLPTPKVVQRGENHFQIAMNFLLNEQKIKKKEALKLIERVLLFDPLVPGFKVWNFLIGGEYGTFITQGNAAISPNEVRRRYKKTLVDARDQAIAERDKLAYDIEALESKRGEVILQLELLNREKYKLITQMSDLNKENLEMNETINSLFYLVDLKKNLKKRRIIKGGFLKSTKIINFSPEFFNKSIDLRARDTIKISAANFNKKKIRKVVLYPKYYKKGVDYKVSISKDKKMAELVILDTTKLKNERVVISVE